MANSYGSNVLTNEEKMNLGVFYAKQILLKAFYRFGLRWLTNKLDQSRSPLVDLPCENNQSVPSYA